MVTMPTLRFGDCSLKAPYSEIEETCQGHGAIFGAADSQVKALYTATKKKSPRRKDREHPLSAMPPHPSHGVCTPRTAGWPSSKAVG